MLIVFFNTICPQSVFNFLFLEGDYAYSFFNKIFLKAKYTLYILLYFKKEKFVVH